MTTHTEGHGAERPLTAAPPREGGLEGGPFSPLPENKLSEPERQVRAALESLTPKQRFVLERAWGLTDGTVYSFREIARAMGLKSHKTVMEHYHAGLDRLVKAIPDPPSLITHLEVLTSEPLVAPAEDVASYFDLKDDPESPGGYSTGYGNEVAPFFPKPGTRMPAPPREYVCHPLSSLPS